MVTFILELIGCLIGLWLFIPGLSRMLLVSLRGLFLFLLFLWLWFIIFNLGQVELDFVILMILVLTNLRDIMFHGLGCRTKISPN